MLWLLIRAHLKNSALHINPRSVATFIYTCTAFLQGCVTKGIVYRIRTHNTIVYTCDISVKIINNACGHCTCVKGMARQEGGGEGARGREEKVTSLHVIVSCYISTSNGISLQI